VLGLTLPADLLTTVLIYRLKLARVISPLVCWCVMGIANYTEHVLSPPVEPRAIVSFSGKSVFFTVNVIGTLFAYFSVSLVANLLILFDMEVEWLTFLTCVPRVPRHLQQQQPPPPPP
jgi:hypothetical protein